MNTVRHILKNELAGSERRAFATGFVHCLPHSTFVRMGGALLRRSLSMGPLRTRPRFPVYSLVILLPPTPPTPTYIKEQADGTAG